MGFGHLPGYGESTLEVVNTSNKLGQGQSAQEVFSYLRTITLEYCGQNEIDGWRTDIDRIISQVKDQEDPSPERNSIIFQLVQLGSVNSSHADLLSVQHYNDIVGLVIANAKIFKDQKQMITKLYGSHPISDGYLPHRPAYYSLNGHQQQAITDYSNQYANAKNDQDFGKLQLECDTSLGYSPTYTQKLKKSIEENKEIGTLTPDEFKQCYQEACYYMDLDKNKVKINLLGSITDPTLKQQLRETFDFLPKKDVGEK